MDELLKNLFYFTEEYYGVPPQSAEHRVAVRKFHEYMDQLDEAMGTAFQEELYEAILHYQCLEAQDGFRLGLRLGLQLQAL